MANPIMQTCARTSESLTPKQALSSTQTLAQSSSASDLHTSAQTDPDRADLQQFMNTRLQTCIQLESHCGLVLHVAATGECSQCSLTQMRLQHIRAEAHTHTLAANCIRQHINDGGIMAQNHIRTLWPGGPTKSTNLSAKAPHFCTDAREISQ